jgi:hypothetical protein
MAESVELGSQVAHIWALIKRHCRLRGKPGDHCEGAQNCIVYLPHGTVASHLKELSIDDHHLAVQILKCPYSQIAVLPQDADTYGALIYPLNEGRSGRDLVYRVVSDIKVSGESLIDDMPQRLTVSLKMSLQKLPYACR